MRTICSPQRSATRAYFGCTSTLLCEAEGEEGITLGSLEVYLISRERGKKNERKKEIEREEMLRAAEKGRRRRMRRGRRMGTV